MKIGNLVLALPPLFAGIKAHSTSNPFLQPTLCHISEAAHQLGTALFQPNNFVNQDHRAQLTSFLKFCGDINSPAWEKTTPKLNGFLQARMQKSSTQEIFFGEELSANSGGICYGMSEVWTALHNAKPEGSATTRMALLMTERGVTHATRAQGLYVMEWGIANSFSQNPSAFNLEPENKRQDIMNTAALFGTRAKLLDNQPTRTKQEYNKLGARLSETKGYYHLSLNLQGKRTASHALRVFSNGADKQPLTIFDSNLGEFHIHPNEMGVFMDELSNFYHQTRNLRITAIQSKYKIEVTSPLYQTSLRNLAQDFL